MTQRSGEDRRETFCGSHAEREKKIEDQAEEQSSMRGGITVIKWFVGIGVTVGLPIAVGFSVAAYDKLDR